MKKISLTGFLFFFCCPISVLCQIIFTSPEDAVIFANQNARERVVEKELVLANLNKARVNVQDYLPQLSVSLSESNSVSFNATDSRNKNLQFSLSETIFDPSRKLNYQLSKIQAVYACKENFQSAKSFEAEIITSYFNCLIARRQLQIKTELLEKTQAELKIMEARAILGMILQTDYLEFLTSTLKIQNELESARRDCKIKERALKVAAGIEDSVQLQLADSIEPEFVQNTLEPFTAQIWNIAKKSSIELQKQDITLEYSRKQQQLQNAWYMPNFALKPAVTFSGEDYPLTNPSYSVQLSLSFQNIPFAPLSVSNNYTYTQKTLTGVSNSASTNLPSSITHFSDQRISELTLLQQQLTRQNYEKQLYTTLYEQLVSHDDYLRTLTILEQTRDLQEQRLAFSKLQLDQGTLKPGDYLEQLIDFSNTRISLVQTAVSAAASERTIAILTGMSFKELLNVCK